MKIAHRPRPAFPARSASLLIPAGRQAPAANLRAFSNQRPPVTNRRLFTSFADPYTLTPANSHRYKNPGGGTSAIRNAVIPNPRFVRVRNLLPPSTPPALHPHPCVVFPPSSNFRLFTSFADLRDLTPSNSHRRKNRQAARAPFFRFPISDFRFPISDFRFPISDFRFPISDFRFPISDFRFPISDFRFPLSAFRFPLSAFRFPLPDFRVSLSAFRVSIFEFRFSSFDFRVSSFDFRVSSSVFLIRVPERILRCLPNP